MKNISLHPLLIECPKSESETTIIFSDYELYELLDLSDWIVLKNIIFKKIVFNQGVKACKTLFKSGLAFDNCYIKRMFVEDSDINGFFQLKKVEFNSAASLTGTIFRQGFEIDECTFGHMATFDNITIDVNDVNRDYAFIKHTRFDDILDLSNSRFNSLLFFENVIFVSDVDFTGVRVIDESYDKARYCALTFFAIIIKENGILKFIGTEKNKVFNNDILFSEEVVEGKIEFEYANYHKINIDARTRFAHLLREDKVVIGRGCLKYRHETPKKRLLINTESQSIVTELANTFVQFFINKNGINLGVETRERSVEYIDIVYFTDEDITYSEFEAMLRNSEGEMWELVKIKNQVVTTENPFLSFPDKIITGGDTIIDLLGIILKILTRIPLGKISPKELRSLMTTTSFNEGGKINVSSFGNITINQTILLGIGNNQSAKIS